MTSTPMIECEGLVKIYKTDELEVVALQGLVADVRANPRKYVNLRIF